MNTDNNMTNENYLSFDVNGKQLLLSFILESILCIKDYIHFAVVK